MAVIHNIWQPEHFADNVLNLFASDTFESSSKKKYYLINLHNNNVYLKCRFVKRNWPKGLQLFKMQVFVMFCVHKLCHLWPFFKFQPGGCADDNWQLKVGHIVLEVNGQPTQGLSHQDVARAIAQAFKDRRLPALELVVRDPSTTFNMSLWWPLSAEIFLYEVFVTISIFFFSYLFLFL